jgi:GntR family transcriptional regulator
MSDDAETTLPAYKQLAHDLREEVLRGGFSDGAKLPTEADIVAERKLSRQTVRHAFAELVGEGLIYRIRGRGTFAVPDSGRSYLRSSGTIEDLLALSIDTELEVIRPLIVRTDVEAAGRLSLRSDEVAAATWRRLHHGEPFVYSVVFMPPDAGRVRGVADLLREHGTRTDRTIIGLLDSSKLGPIAGAHQSITAVPTPSDVAELIGGTAGAACLRIDRLYFNRDGEFIMLVSNFFNTERYSYRVELRR